MPGVTNYSDSFTTLGAGGSSLNYDRTPEMGGGGRKYLTIQGRPADTGLPALDNVQGMVDVNGGYLATEVNAAQQYANIQWGASRARSRDQGAVMHAQVTQGSAGLVYGARAKIFLQHIRFVEDPTTGYPVDSEGYTAGAGANDNVGYEVTFWTNGFRVNNNTGRSGVQIVRFEDHAGTPSATSILLEHETNVLVPFSGEIPLAALQVGYIFKFEANIINGTIRVYVEDILIGTVTDALPLNAVGYTGGEVAIMRNIFTGGIEQARCYDFEAYDFPGGRCMVS